MENSKAVFCGLLYKSLRRERPRDVTREEIVISVFVIFPLAQLFNVIYAAYFVLSTFI